MLLDGAKGEILKIRKEVIRTLITLITAAFGFIAALSWNEAIKGLFAKYLAASSTLAQSLYYAIMITMIAVVVTIFLGRMKAKMKID